jgi:hypothetical protein
MYSWDKRGIIKGVTMSMAGLLLMNEWLGATGIVIWAAGIWMWDRYFR